MDSQGHQPVPAEDLVSYFIERLSGRIGRTMVLKLVYIADLESRRYRGRPISDLKYVLHQHGPFDPRIYRALDGLKERGEVREEQVFYPSGLGYRYHSVHPGRTHAFTNAEESILSFVLRSYTDKRLADILDVVYDTKPMKSAGGQPHGTPLPMHVVDGEMRLALSGIDLESALAGEEDVRQGRTVSWQNLKSELSDRIRRRGG